MREIFLKFPLFYLVNEEIQQKMEQKNILNFFTLNFLGHKIKERECQKKLYHFFTVVLAVAFLSYFYFYFNNRWLDRIQLYF